MAAAVIGWRAREWRDRLERFPHSGMTVSTFCLRESVSEASFYSWRRKLGETSRYRPEAKPREPVFAPIRLVTSPGVPEPLVSVQLPGGTRFEIPMSDSVAFERTILALASADAQRTTTPLSEDSSC
jgi:hypothetical protein